MPLSYPPIRPVEEARRAHGFEADCRRAER